jgi:protein-S-isoprenylcysteine O-methyltransferase Ste14
MTSVPFCIVSLLSELLLTALLITPLLARIRAEKKLLRTQFGGEYDAYCSRTSQLIPGLY